jgi:NAD-dependent deacetylase
LGGASVEDVATPEAWAANPGLVLDFYSQRVWAAEPNAAHKALVDLERACDVRIVTQNGDDLHERAGSTQVLHLHGEVMLARSTRDPRLVRHLGERGWTTPELAERVATPDEMLLGRFTGEPEQ